MCRLHFCANANKATDSQIRTLRKSFAGCTCNMVVDSNPDWDVGAGRVREEAAGRTVVDILESARRLLCPELVGDTVVAGVVDGQCLSNKLLWRDRRRCSFWFFFLVVLLIAVGHGLLSTVVLNHLRMRMHVLVLMHEFQEE